MAFTNNYSVNTHALASSHWSFSGPAGTNLANNAANNGNWTWRNGASPSNGVGTDGPKAGESGYIYTEMSGQTAGDIWHLTFNDNYDASTNDVTFNFSWGARGNAVRAIINVQTNEGNGWTTRGTYGYGNNPPATGSATNVYVDEALDLTCLLYTSPSPRDKRQSRMPSSA